MAGVEFLELPKTIRLSPPWKSNGRVNRAGEAIRERSLSNDDVHILNIWRAAHNKILNNFQTMIRRKTKGRNIIVAQRLKRRMTIVDKLFRESRMQLARMDDVAGCRMIFKDVESLYTFRAEFHDSRFRHKRKNSLDKYDYIKRPKGSGYRSIHDIYAYDARSARGAVYNGLMIELQYRTNCQHAWATASELVTQMAGSEPKFGRGDPRHMEYFRLASELIARAFEGHTSCYPDISDSDVVEKFQALEDETEITYFLTSLRVFDVIGQNVNSMILQITEDSGVIVHEFTNSEEAENRYFELEQGDLIEHGVPKEDILLVAGETFAQIRAAYLNYFSDAREFLHYIKEGRNILQGAE